MTTKTKAGISKTAGGILFALAAAVLFVCGAVLLPAERASADTPTGVNLLENPGFEDGLLHWTTVGTLTDIATANNSQKKSGAYSLRHLKNVAYEARTSQTLTNLSKGSYTAKAWVRRPAAAANHEIARIEASGHGGTMKIAEIGVSDSFYLVTLDNIHVTTGQCVITIHSKAAQANQVLYVDDIELTLVQPDTSLTVSFRSNGGTPVADQNVPSGGAAVPPAAPVKPGYGLAGWYKDAALTEPYDFGMSLTADMTLYAKWVRHEVPMIGAIRWDAFNGYVPDEALSLSPIQHHYRVPYFLGFDGSGAVTGHENSQATIDEQIAYAKAGGIDYWAFVTGPELSPNNNEYYALNKYLSSSHKADVGFSVILHRYGDSPWADRVDALVAWMQEPGYVKVFDDRPLVYIFKLADMESKYGAGTGTGEAIALIRSKAQAAGIGNPYIVAMANETGIAQGAQSVDTYGLDAISAYSFKGSGSLSSVRTYEAFAAQNSSSWESYLNTNKKMIPLVAMGRNEKPRFDTLTRFGGGTGPYWDNPTPYEAAKHVREGLDFALQHPSAVETNSVLLYAWNEYAEGGWIAPTHSEGMSKLDAIRAMKDGYLGATNLLQNAGFEQAGLTGWTHNGTVTEAAYAAVGGRTGNGSLKHQFGTAYEVRTSQTVEGLSNGKYRAIAWVKSSGGQEAARMEAHGYGGGLMTAAIPESAVWTSVGISQPVSIENIEVTNGTCTISFYSKASGGQWIMVDDVELFRADLDNEVSFELQKEELSAQILPPLPYKRIVYKGTFVFYRLDVYDNHKDAVFHLSENSPKSRSDHFFRLNDEGVRLSRSTVTALRMMNY